MQAVLMSGGALMDRIEHASGVNIILEIKDWGRREKARELIWLLALSL